MNAKSISQCGKNAAEGILSGKAKLERLQLAIWHANR
jgi:hypothetical protein